MPEKLKDDYLDKFILKVIAHPEIPCGLALLMLVLMTLLENLLKRGL